MQGSVIDGPSQASLYPLVVQFLPLLMQRMEDPSMVLRHSATWTLGRIFEFIPEAVDESTGPAIMPLLLARLSDETHVINQACFVRVKSWLFTQA